MDKQERKAESRKHQIGMFFRCNWHMQKPCPWATALIFTWLEATRRLQGSDSVPGPIVAQPMEQEAHLPLGCVSGNGLVLGSKGLMGPLVHWWLHWWLWLLVVLVQCWGVVSAGNPELRCRLWGSNWVSQSAGTRAGAPRLSLAVVGVPRLSELAPALLQVAMPFWVSDMIAPAQH